LCQTTPVAPPNLKRKILQDPLHKNESHDAAFRIIRSIPEKKIATAAPIKWAYRTRLALGTEFLHQFAKTKEIR
jgi:hypothetical protein